MPTDRSAVTDISSHAYHSDAEIFLLKDLASSFAMTGREKPPRRTAQTLVTNMLAEHFTGLLITGQTGTQKP